MQFNPTMHKLSNGVTVLLDQMDIETINVKVLFKTGARDEAPSEFGITHFAEHMLCKGTTRFPNSKDTEDYFDYWGGTKNASTSNSMLQFYGRILADNANVLIDYIGDQIQNSLFLPDKIDIERKVISDELRRSLDDPSRQLWHFSTSALFPKSALSNRTLGTLENINAFSRDQMLEFLSRRLSASNCIVGISGKITDKDKILKDLEKALGWLPSFDVLENSEIEYAPNIAHNSQADKKNIKLRVYFPDIWMPAFENRFKNMCVGKFERYMGKELFEIIRRQNGLTYGFYGADIGNENFGLTGFSTETSAENIEKVVALVAQHSCRIYNENKITDEDLERFSRKNKLGDADFLESAGRRCDKLINFYRNWGQIYDFNETIRLSDSIRREDVIENSRGFFDGAMSIVTQGADYDADLKSVWVENFK